MILLSKFIDVHAYVITAAYHQPPTHDAGYSIAELLNTWYYLTMTARTWTSGIKILIK